VNYYYLTKGNDDQELKRLGRQAFPCEFTYNRAPSYATFILPLRCAMTGLNPLNLINLIPIP